MSASQLLKLSHLGLDKTPLVSVATPAQNDYVVRRRLLKKYEPTTPVFSSFREEIEWRLSTISVNLIKNAHQDTAEWFGLARHWIRTAILAGYYLEADRVVSKKEGHLYICPAMVTQWNEEHEKLLVDFALHLHPEHKPKPPTVTYSFFDSYGRCRQTEAENICDLIMQVFEIKLPTEEKKKCLSMVASMSKYFNRKHRLTIVKKNGKIAISHREDNCFFEIVAMEKKEQKVC